MKLNKYFFKKYWHTLRRRLFDTLRRGKRTILEFRERLSHTGNIRLWFRENTLLKDGKYFLKTLYARLVIRGEYRTRDLVVLLVAAFFVGVAGKAAATQVITIGFDDYTLPPKETLLDLNAVQKKMIGNGSAFIESDAAQAGVCSE